MSRCPVCHQFTRGTIRIVRGGVPIDCCTSCVLELQTYGTKAPLTAPSEEQLLFNQTEKREF